ncbi:MAG: efflux RND transporter periplasmic adaptor subunit [Lentisphaeria bacterium]|nr:efflux RND transporter periplasmic adaptor subunit [Lentisphaeria bacterium]
MIEQKNSTETSVREVRKPSFGGFLAVALVMLVATGWLLRGLMPPGKPTGPPGGGPGGPTALLAIVAAPVGEGPTELPREYVGHVEAMQHVNVCAEVPGTIETVHFTEGNYVERDTLLYTICQDRYRARVALAEAGGAQARAGLAAAEAARTVAGADLVAVGADLDGARANLTAAVAGVEAANAGQGSADANVERARKFLKRLQDADERSISQADLDAAVNDSLQGEAGVARSKAEVAQATARVVQVQAVIRQVEGRLAQSRARLIHAESGIDQAQATIRQATADLQLARIDLAYTEIRSPIAGRIGKALVTEGNLVGPVTGPLARVVQTDPVRVTFAMTDRAYLDRIQVPGNDRQPQITLRLPNGTLYSEGGVWDHANNEMDPRTANLAIRLRFDNPDGLLIPHGYVTVILEKRDCPHAPQIPVEAVVADECGHFVFVVDASDTVNQRRITLGSVLGNRQCVRKGLEIGERVVVGGLQKVNPGQKVIVSEQMTDGGA